MPVPFYLLDTGVLLRLIRGNATAVRIEAKYQLRHQNITPLICIVTRGEIWSLARENAWGHAKCVVLGTMLDSLVTIDIGADDVIEAYVEIDDASRKWHLGSIRMGKNDLWIAAVAKVSGAVLLTCDHDFDHLDPGQLRRDFIDPKAGPAPAPGAKP